MVRAILFNAANPVSIPKRNKSVPANDTFERLPMRRMIPANELTKRRFMASHAPGLTESAFTHKKPIEFRTRVQIR
jgi:hypothetical protein